MIYLGADHGGFSLKESIKKYLESLNYEYKDLGNTVIDNDDDYPVYAFAVAEAVAKYESSGEWKDKDKGILFCRSAGGVIVAANKVNGAFAIPCYDENSAKHARLHNDANIIAISGDWTTEEKAKKIIKIFLETEFSNEERHVRRIKMITDYESRK